MSETFTIVGVGLTSSSVGVTFATLFPEATPAVMLGSLAGTALYVLTSESPSTLEAGYLCADIVYQWRVLLRTHGENHGRNHQHAVKPDEATGQH